MTLIISGMNRVVRKLIVQLNSVYGMLACIHKDNLHPSETIRKQNR